MGVVEGGCGVRRRSWLLIEGTRVTLKVEDEDRAVLVLQLSSQVWYIAYVPQLVLELCIFHFNSREFLMSYRS